MIKVLFTGGGTGGHVFPIIAISRELFRLGGPDNVKIYYIGPNDDSELNYILLKQEQIETYRVFSGKLRRYFSFKNLKDFFKIPIGVFQSLLILIKIKPDLVFSKGGYGSIPTVIASFILRKPLFLHESDVVPGLSNQIASHFAKKIFVSFKKTEYFSLNKVKVVGNPIRKGILGGNRDLAKKIFNLTFKKPIILVLGGSQGSRKINDFFTLYLNNFLKEFEIIHQCGFGNLKEIKDRVSLFVPKEMLKYYHLIEFLNENELREALNVADLVVSRAGSGAIFEIAAVGKPSILIPLANSASNHQAKNAYYYQEFGACEVVEEGNLTPNFFFEKLKYIIFSDSKRKEMQENAKKFAKINAARNIAMDILDYIGKYL